MPSVEQPKPQPEPEQVVEPEITPEPIPEPEPEPISIRITAAGDNLLHNTVSFACALPEEKCVFPVPAGQQRREMRRHVFLHREIEYETTLFIFR